MLPLSPAPSKRELHWKMFFSRDTINTQSWALLLFKASPIHCIHRPSSPFVSTVWTWFWPFLLLIWENYGHYFYLPRCGLESLTLHLSSGAQPAPLPNRALSPFPLLGPRCVTHEKAQGPGSLLQSCSCSLWFVDSAPLHPALVAPGGSVEFWRMESTVWHPAK